MKEQATEFTSICVIRWIWWELGSGASILVRPFGGSLYSLTLPLLVSWASLLSWMKGLELPYTRGNWSLYLCIAVTLSDWLKYLIKDSWPLPFSVFGIVLLKVWIIGIVRLTCILFIRRNNCRNLYKFLSQSTSITKFSQTCSLVSVASLEYVTHPLFFYACLPPYLHFVVDYFVATATA